MSPAVFFDVSNKLGTPARLVIELFDNEAPELCQKYVGMVEDNIFPRN